MLNTTYFNSFVQSLFEESDSPGFAMSVIRSHELIYSNCLGRTSIHTSSKEITEYTLFPIHSLTKAFVAAALGILVDRGKLKFDDAVSKHLDDFRLYDPEASAKVTIRDLLSHQSGLPRHDFASYKSGISSMKALYGKLRHLPSTKPLRGGFQYNNLVWSALGVLIERVSGEPWEDFIRNNIFLPLNMRDTQFHDEDKNSCLRAKGHQYRQGKVVVIPHYNENAIAPAGAIQTCLHDMTPWIIMNLNHGRCLDHRIISRGVLGEIHREQVAMPWPVPAKEMTSSKYCLGWWRYRYRGVDVIEHSGGGDGFIAWAVLVPSHKVGIVMLRNFEPAMPLQTILPFAVKYRIIDRICGKRALPWSLRLKRAFRRSASILPAKQTPKKRTHKPVKAHEGTYHHPGYGSFQLRLSGCRMTGCFGMKNLVVRLHAPLEGTFMLPDNGVSFPVSFTKDCISGIKEALVELEPSIKIKFKKAVHNACGFAHSTNTCRSS